MLPVNLKEHLRERLRKVCADHGGADAVASELEVSGDYLKQILAETKLQGSKKARGVGPGLQDKLDARYPGWWSPDPVKKEEPSQTDMLSPQAMHLGSVLDIAKSRPKEHAAMYLKALELLGDVAVEPYAVPTKPARRVG